MLRSLVLIACRPIPLQAVFVHTIKPLLSSVRMHPFLVTHSREYEKSSLRWKRMEVHDVFVESSRYTLVNQESTGEDEELSNVPCIAENNEVVLLKTTLSPGNLSVRFSLQWF